MSRKNKKILLSLFVFTAILLFNSFVSTFPSKQNDTNGNVLGDKSLSWTAARIVDGDTIEVKRGSETQKVRVIGINTPETVDPRREVECFGKEASEHAKKLLEGKSVVLIPDLSQSEVDRYGRILRYITMPDGEDYGKVMISEGYAYEYTYDNPYSKKQEYEEAQKEAANAKKGLWGERACK